MPTLLRRSQRKPTLTVGFMPGCPSCAATKLLLKELVREHGQEFDLVLVENADLQPFPGGSPERKPAFHWKNRTIGGLLFWLDPEMLSDDYESFEWQVMSRLGQS